MKVTLLNWQDNLTISEREREREREVLFSICDSSIAAEIHNYITITIQYYNRLRNNIYSRVDLSIDLARPWSF